MIGADTYAFYYLINVWFELLTWRSGFEVYWPFTSALRTLKWLIWLRAAKCSAPTTINCRRISLSKISMRSTSLTVFSSLQVVSSRSASFSLCSSYVCWLLPVMLVLHARSILLNCLLSISVLSSSRWNRPLWRNTGPLLLQVQHCPIKHVVILKSLSVEEFFK